MALTFATAIGLINAGATVADLASAGLRKYQEWRDPVGFNKTQALRRANISPEQYEIRRRLLSEGLQTLQNPQMLFSPGVPQLQQAGGETEGIPTQLGEGAQPQYTNGLAGLLNNLAAQAQRGYQEDLGRIGSRFGARNVVGRSSGELGLRQEAQTGRGLSYLRNAYQYLQDYATRNAIAEIEAGKTNVAQTAAEQRLQDFATRVQQQQQGGFQAEYLGQQNQALGEAQLGNILSNEQRQQAVRKYQAGQISPYEIQQTQQQKLGGI